MTKTDAVISTKFHDFLQQRNHRTNVAMQTAQRLINLYRVLGSFGADFVEQYNTMLLNSTDEVQMALNGLVSGQEVRQYLEFLQREAHIQTQDETSENVAPQTGWLPNPADEQTSGAGASSANLTEFMKNEEEKIAQMITSLRQEQELAIKHLSDQLAGTLQSRSNEHKSAQREDMTSYSEIIEERGKDKS